MKSKKVKSIETEKTRLLIIIHTCTYVPKLLFSSWVPSFSIAESILNLKIMKKISRGSE